MKRPPKGSGETSFIRGDVLLLIDLINDLEFLGGEKVMPWARKLSLHLVNFKTLAQRNGMPVIYVNDNFNRWRSSFAEVYAHCTRPSARGREICLRFKPEASDYFVLKPRHSGFFATSLLPLLEHLNAKRLVLAGISTNLCVLFTAHDAHMQGYSLVMLSDCCAAETNADHNIALNQLKRFCGAVVCKSREFRFPKPISTRERK